MNQTANNSINDLYILDDDNQNERLCGLPLLRIPSLKLSLQIIPVTKIQFEYFLCDQPDPDFSESVYNEMLSLNPRISPNQISADNHWKIFLTGIKPQEAQKFASWLGDSYQIPTKEEWGKIYNALNKVKDVEFYSRILSDYHGPERVKNVLIKLRDTIQNSSGDNRLTDTLLMRNGVMEWVARPDVHTEWGGMGVPKFHTGTAKPDADVHETPRLPGTYRFDHYGFRLIKRLD